MPPTTTLNPGSLNQLAFQLCDTVIDRKRELRVSLHRSESGATVLDFGAATSGGIEAGRLLAEICCGGLAKVHVRHWPDALWGSRIGSLSPAGAAVVDLPYVEVFTDWPLWSCMGAQYAGWPLNVGEQTVICSGPIRMIRGREAVLKKYSLREKSEVAVAVLELERLPDAEMIQALCAEVSLPGEALTVCVAPTASLAGAIQIVARSIETAMHKLSELEFDLTLVTSAIGRSPLPPLTQDNRRALGWTNDSIMYGSVVWLAVDADDGDIEKVGKNLPSSASGDYGEPFQHVFDKYEGDFFKIDPALFSPAEVTILNRRSGRSWRFGQVNHSILAASFFGGGEE